MASYLFLFISCLLFLGANAGDLELPNPGANMELIPAGSLIIPMDQAYQSLTGEPFNLRAYGLVVQQLWNLVPVKWAIRSGKSKDTADFTASAARLYPSPRSATTIAFRGGPFIFPNPSMALMNNISRFAAANLVAVYQLQQDTMIDIRYTIDRKPFCLVLDDGNTAYIHTDILEEAAFSQDWYRVTDMAVLINYNSSALCYSHSSEPHFEHYSTVYGQWLRDFLTSGGNHFAQCIGKILFLDLI
eukprot:TRINITY_DN17504_c0_g1_i1.p1 TRINITY_DN17504_c0_g1~~TRINITY_DN17504_c0_g1_i1.p1  ORF type:complete len:245 (+),score=24.57 TRINITY_DN17504_c0_g1_i1:335-1069(+)